MWIGANDIGKEGLFRFINGTEFIPNKDTLYDWQMGQPNNSGNCVHIYMISTIAVKDDNCERVENIYGDEIPFHGLCEIKRYQNCIV